MISPSEHLTATWPIDCGKLRDHARPTATVLIGNKTDLEHLRFNQEFRDALESNLPEIASQGCRLGTVMTRVK